MQKELLINLLLSTPFEWTADYGRQTARVLTKDHQVWCLVWHNTRSLKELLVSGEQFRLLERLGPRLWVYTAIHWLPGKRWPWVVTINKRLNVWIFRWLQFLRLIGTHFERRVTWIFDPGLSDLLIDFGQGTVLYDSVDFFAGALSGQEREQFEVKEKQLAKRADFAFANSHFLYERIRRNRTDVILVPQGFDSTAFANSSSQRQVFAATKKPVIGYVGGMNERLNYDLLFGLIERHPEWKFVFWGPQQYRVGDLKTRRKVERLRGYANVIMGEGLRSELGSVLQSFTVGMIPYTNTDFNTYCHPMKIFEYYYFGIPAVSSRIYELTFPEYREFVRVAETAEAWEKVIRFFIHHPLTKDQKKQQRRLANEQAWEIKVGKIVAEIL